MITLQSVIFWLIIAFLVTIIAYLLFRKGKIERSSFIASPLLAFYLSFVIKITITERVSSPNAAYRLIPCWSYRAILNGEVDLIFQIIWNVVLFIPIGFLLMLFLTFKQKRLLSFVISLLMSAVIESIQLIFHLGLFELDDIIHNTLGAIIGTCAYAFIIYMRKRINCLLTNL